jgi:hypothetical protein
MLCSGRNAVERGECLIAALEDVDVPVSDRRDTYVSSAASVVTGPAIDQRAPESGTRRHRRGTFDRVTIEGEIRLASRQKIIGVRLYLLSMSRRLSKGPDSRIGNGTRLHAGCLHRQVIFL